MEGRTENSEIEQINPVVWTFPKEGLNVLEWSDIEKTIPPLMKGGKPAWKEWDQYDEKAVVSATLFRPNHIMSDDDTKADVTCDIAMEYGLEVYRQKLMDPVCTMSSSNKPLWEAFDILWEPEWKMIASRYMGGLTEADIAIVRLLKNDYDGTGISFCSLYINNNMYSKYFSDQRRLQREGKIDPNYEINIMYDVDSCCQAGGDFPALMDAFKHAYYLNGEKPFPIIEQIRDYRDGNSKVLLSNIDPKTELRTEHNIFINLDKPRSVLTNFRPQVFMCEYFADNNCFIVTKKR